MKITLLEHKPYSIKKEGETLKIFEAIPHICPYILKKDRQGNPVYPFEIKRTNDEEVCLQAGYYIGALWLVKHHKFVYIEPKMNKKQIAEGSSSQEEWAEIDYLKMLLSITGLDPKDTQDLIKIYWDEPPITIEQQKDTLTPFLMVQFLLLLKRIVRKGLKKSYYTVEENLNSRIKGKIQLAKHLKQNVFKNKLTAHVCRYQEFGMDNLENRFLKKVLQFIISFKNTHANYFAGNDKSIRELITYCSPYFELISEEINIENLKKLTTNTFFKEYEEAIRIGKHILKRFSYNITETTQQKVTIPPFCIDMPKLFELYVYKKLQEQFGREAVTYHLTADYTELDFLLNTPEYKMVIDAKYKPIYEDNRVIDDIRQVSGYARLERVYQKLGLEGSNKLIDCLIIYPSLDEDTNFFLKDKKIAGYRNIYKQSISIPLITNL
ncbi:MULTISPECIES: restriction endonuclease [Capnocytophaga]|uniref:5-methylcytosine restriction system specificity protein McrC n=1 Tax=Capnocytophaga TaxID=1016 RepID=UPI00020C690E|nr:MULTISPECIES: restriction endonuclease [unclassified Capnocytophaga]KHE71380.1 hypothetical protein HMPREF9074_07029 [Capnocytophaga sp. oral taxon 329 str. F0087]QGS17799.1 restriction endonuclease [Capnocytophaga sp. FDAARGOS_737]